MKKVIVISLVSLLSNSADVFAQTSPPATEKDFTATSDASIRQTIAM